MPTSRNPDLIFAPSLAPTPARRQRNYPVFAVFGGYKGETFQITVPILGEPRSGPEISNIIASPTHRISSAISGQLTGCTDGGFVLSLTGCCLSKLLGLRFSRDHNPAHRFKPQSLGKVG